MENAALKGDQREPRGYQGVRILSKGDHQSILEGGATAKPDAAGCKGRAVDDPRREPTCRAEQDIGRTAFAPREMESLEGF